jgi:restriction system protein
MNYVIVAPEKNPSDAVLSKYEQRNPQREKNLDLSALSRGDSHMGAIWFKANEYAAFLSEATGFKAGIALSKDDLAELFADDDEERGNFLLPEEQRLRIRAEDIEQTFAYILFKLGNIGDPSTVPISIRLFHKYKGDPILRKLNEDVFRLYVEEAEKMMDAASLSGSKALDPTNFLTEARSKFGSKGLAMALEIVDGLIQDQDRSLGSFRRVEWTDAVELKALFHSESLDASYGKFLDQRFIDYLYRNQDKVGDMHWRKFEGLAGEFFDREGYKVEMGPGRNDGGVDIRVWKESLQPGEPPLMLVQCKRQKANIERAVVKSLWADMEWERAKSGLIVTTASLSPGAQQDCTSRGYNIRQADKAVISKWLESMRTPGSGVFMGS